jgi:hypothetical protein
MEEWTCLVVQANWADNRHPKILRRILYRKEQPERNEQYVSRLMEREHYQKFAASVLCGLVIAVEFVRLVFIKTVPQVLSPAI